MPTNSKKIMPNGGVYEKNIFERNRHLKNNLGKYSQWTEELMPAIGDLYDINYYKPLYDITDGQSLLDYTHNGSEEYGHEINQRYFIKDRMKEIVGFENPMIDDMLPWAGRFIDYPRYMDEILGEDIYSRHVRYINDLLSGQYIENALRQTEVAVIKPMVTIARQGIITTNKNNLKGIDTQLGIISNYMYSTLLYNGSLFNADRRSNEKYLTPSLYNQYGNNLSNMPELGDILNVGTNEYRLSDDLGADVKIFHNIEDKIDDINLKYLTNNIDEATKYVNENYNGYYGYFQFGKDSYIKVVEDERYNPITDISNITKFGEKYVLNFKSPISGNGERISSPKTVTTYDETDYADKKTRENVDINSEDNEWDIHSAIDDNSVNNGLLSKTNKLFSQHKIDTLVGRFHTSQDGTLGDNYNKTEFIDTAKSKFGNSHGRNLLTLDAQQDGKAANINGYTNPYCRTWTYHHQYNQVKKLIRPFMGDNDNASENTALSIEEIQRRLKKYRNKETGLSKNNKPIDGGQYLADNTVLGNSGFVNICPSNENGNKVDIRKCMFSIENLAWKDILRDEKERYISKEQTGPNKGRIMWFPPYDLSFQENVNVDWQSNSFIGRGEKIYTYTNTDRTGSLSFTMLIDHPSIVNSFAKLEQGKYRTDGTKLSDDIDSDILRFFAGCSIPDIDSEDKNKNTTGETTNKKEKIEGKEQHIRFYVFFPNNFTGSITKTTTPKVSSDYVEDEYYSSEKFDSETYVLGNWWLYLLFGNNCSLPIDSDKWVGYETNPVSGISEGNIDEDMKKQLVPVGSCNAGNVWTSNCVGNNGQKDWSESSIDDDKYCWKYRPDGDMRQKLNGGEKSESYIDRGSKQLNSKLNEYYTDANYTFADFVCALFETDDYHIGYFNIDDDSKNAAINYLYANGAEKDRVRNLVNIFKLSEDDIEYCDSTVYGYADVHDKIHSSMLAHRRSASVIRLLTSTIMYGTNINNKTKNENVGGEQKQTEDSLINKLKRYAFVDIVYKLKDETILLSDGNSNKAVEVISDEEQKKFDDWYTELSTASIVREYENLYNNEDFEQKYESFQEWLMLDFCKNNNISYDINDYNTDDDWNNVIDKLIGSISNENEDNNGFGYKYLLPADLLSYTNNGFNGEFIQWLNNHPIQGATEQIEKEINELRSKKAEKESELSDIENSIEKEDTNYESEESKSSELHEQLETLENNIKAKEQEISDKEEEIKNVRYELDHWTVDKKDKKELTKQLNKLQKENDKLGNELLKLKGEYSEVNSDYKQCQVNIKDSENKLVELRSKKAEKENEIQNIKNEIQNKEQQKESGNIYSLDLINTELYYQKMNENSLFNIESYNDWDEDDVENIHYMNNTKIKQSLSNLPYKKYNDVVIDNDSENKIFSSILLLQDYLVIYNLKDMEHGFEYAYDYLFNNEDYLNQLKELLYIEYLFNGVTDKDSWITPTGKSDFANVWMWLYYYYFQQKEKRTAIDYKPFLDAISEVYNKDKEGATPTEMVKLAKKHTDEVLKFCNTSVVDILSDIMSEAQSRYDEAKKAADDKDAARQKAILDKKQKAEEKARKDEEERKKKEMDIYLKEVFHGNENIKRYETEGEYFSKIKTTDPLIFKSIQQKFKYFNPAFHSISPEGFNARLNFLHQCTRQGGTVENKGSIGNLAFGRMPVCVLRIGDFINTKIIINSMSITYDNSGGINWDLNPEGIGVQPMFAKVNLSITILGGQSLQGPISRLQNALSFDYYANTGVYDNRADMVEYDNNGNVKYKKIFVATPETNNNNTQQVKTNVDEKTDEIVDIKKLGEQLDDINLHF